MLDKSLFISDTIHEREIELADGKKHKMYFKELAAGDFRRYAIDNESDDEEVQANSMPKLIAACLVDAQGKPALTPEQAGKIKIGPMLAIYHTIQEVNGSSPKKTVTGDSGTS